MDYKKVIIIVILILLLSACAFLVKNNDKSINKTTDNNTIKDKNISNITVNNSSNTSITHNVQSNQNTYNSDKNHEQSKKSKVKSDEITEKDILKRVKKNVWWDDGHGGSTQNVKLGKIYKKDDGLWLVPAFDKKTGKFLGAVWVTSEGGYYGGVDSYSDYKKIISGKTIHKSDLNKSSKAEKVFSVDKSNQNTSLDFDLVGDVGYNVNLNSFNTLENKKIIIDSDTIVNSTY